jgi:3-hydroxy-9,10-secoandrosta-1,3,5(10)-triene-9,17-dione monooxygenase reductase component
VSDEPHLVYGFEDPFLAPAEDRRLDRRLRGRLVAPVTVWTAGAASGRVGLSVSSVLVAEGEPPEILGLLDPLSDLRRVLESTGVFVVHVLDESDRRLASGFAGNYPVDPYEGLEVEDTAYGPVVTGTRSIISCRFTAARAVGYQDLVTAAIERIDLDGTAAPLAYYRGRFRHLAAQG